MTVNRRVLPHLLAVLLLAGACGGENADSPDAAPAVDSAPEPDCDTHVFEDMAVPMRDGAELAATVRHAADPSCRLPTILVQTPYDKENARTLWLSGDTEQPLFDSRAYNVVVVDWRGFFASIDAAADGWDLGEDGYDAVEWIAAQTWSDGKVGTWGVSALCVVQHATAAEQPPHLIAAVPIFCQQGSTYEQYYPGGVLRKEYFDFISAYFGAGIIRQHPTRDATWAFVESSIDRDAIGIPMLHVAGYYDLYNTGSLQTFHGIADAGRAPQYLLMGPWIHFATGGESAGGDPLTPQELEYFDTDRRVQRDSLAFFDHFIRGTGGEAASWDPVRYELGGTWRGAATWPPPSTTPTTYYLAAAGGLTSAAPSSGSVTFDYDPDDPSPTVGGQTLRFDLDHGPQDQASVIARDDARVFVTAPLASPVSIAGAVTVKLAITTTGADTDFAVRLTDVDAGSHLLIGEGIRRLKLRDDLGSASPVATGVRYELTVALTNEHGYTFAAGHQIGVIVSSSNYPRFARNPNTGADFYTLPGASDTVTNTVFIDGVSSIVLPVVD